MGNCCKFLKVSRYRSNEKSSINQVAYKRKLSSSNQTQAANSNSNHTNVNLNSYNSDISLNGNGYANAKNKEKKKSNSQLNGQPNPGSAGVVASGSSSTANYQLSHAQQQSLVQHPQQQQHHGKQHSNQISLTASSENRSEDANLSIPHIADFYPEEDSSAVPADNPRISTLFLPKANIEKRRKMNESTSFNAVSSETNLHTSKKFNSCSTIYIDDSTVSQPNLKSAIRLVACAIHYHIKRRTSDRSLDIFDEKLYPISKDVNVPDDYKKLVPDHRLIYKFMKNLFTAAQLTAECAIVTLIYLERVLTYAEIDLCPANWKRLLLGAILLASKVWDDQAVWNVDYCAILKDINVDNMNELERQYLNLLQFNINVPSSVYAKYYFDLRTLAEVNNLAFPHEPLTKEKALKLEAMSSVCQQKYKDMIELQSKNVRRTASVDNLFSPSRKSLVILS